ncbi:non-specific lipid-transfer protein 1 [Arachis ipaensis]|uniref:non-specific lipid-transfer protein 1 n=1 Tax=Arachis ipaensis TaxID=130454 RepID=UPI000A2B4C8F|nr:non-specific lipid-transfer protein 1 [Arachis ipaensis]
MASIRVTCVVLMVCMALLSAPMVHGAISCGTVTVSLAPCLAYLQRGGAPPLACCQGVKNVLAGARTPADRKTVCTCLKTSAGQVPGINLANAGSLPSKCGVNIPYKISPSTNCNTIKF